MPMTRREKIVLTLWTLVTLAFGVAAAVLGFSAGYHNGY